MGTKILRKFFFFFFLASETFHLKLQGQTTYCLFFSQHLPRYYGLFIYMGYLVMMVDIHTFPAENVYLWIITPLNPFKSSPSLGYVTYEIKSLINVKHTDTKHGNTTVPFRYSSTSMQWIVAIGYKAITYSTFHSSTNKSDRNLEHVSLWKRQSNTS